MGNDGYLVSHQSPSRVVTGNCEWHDSPQFVSDFNELRKFDQFGAMALLELKDAASGRRGLSRHKRDLDYRVPLTPPGKGARVVDPPWMGELKAQGKQVAKRVPLAWEYRLYFGEPVEKPRMCIALGTGTKDPRWPKGDRRQANRIRTLMGYLKSYFDMLGYTPRPFSG